MLHFGSTLLQTNLKSMYNSTKNGLVSLFHQARFHLFQLCIAVKRIVRESPESEEWKNKMKKASKFGNKKIDAGYSIPGGSRSPSRVLAEVTGVYCNLGKALGKAFHIYANVVNDRHFPNS